MPTAKSQTLSIGLHVAFVALVLFLTSRTVLGPPPIVVAPTFVRMPSLRKLLTIRTEPKSGGSNQTALPAKHGQPPPRASRVFIPPTTAPQPKLPMAITVDFESPTYQLDPANLGDPLSKLPYGLLGSVGKDGIGDKPGRHGIGDGDGDKTGISGRAQPGHKITAPVLIYKIEPEFSDAARKAKYQGTVVMSIEVDTEGRARAFRIVQSPGLGLDEKAIEAVQKWKFRPGMQDGRPVVTSAIVQVAFHLL